MKGTTHIAVGVGTALLFQSYSGHGDISSELLAGAVLGALMPDIDTGGLIAKPGKLLRIKSKEISAMLDAIGGEISGIIQKFTEHRGFFHWPILGFCIAVLGYDIESLFLFYFGLGYLSHCLIDALNGKGVPLLAPISMRKRHIADIKYDGWGEKFFLILFFLLVFYYMKEPLLVHLKNMSVKKEW